MTTCKHFVGGRQYLKFKQQEHLTIMQMGIIIEHDVNRELLTLQISE